MLDLKDILGVEYTCGHCQSKYLVPLSKFDRVIHQCPNCKEGLINAQRDSSPRPSDESALLNFVGALNDIQNRNMDIKLEIAASPEGA
jgi:hypothetical protein